MIPINTNPSRRELLKFGLTILLVLGLVGAAAWYWGRPPTPGTGLTGRQCVALALWAFALVGLAAAVLSYVAIGAARTIYVGWMTAATWSGTYVVTPVVFTILYIVVLPVFSLIVRWKDPLRLRPTRAASYWEDHKPHEATLERTSRPF